jgi:hypothetical protein
MVATMAEKYGEWHAMAYCEEEAMAVGADKWHMACFIVTREEGRQIGGRGWHTGLAWSTVTTGIWRARVADKVCGRGEA